MNLREITIDDVQFTIQHREEDIPPEFALKDMKANDPERYRNTVTNIRQSLDYGNEWAWCYVTVTGTFGPLTAKQHLGGCSYDNQTDFIESSGYWNDMRREVVTELNEQARQLVALLEAPTNN